MVNFKNQNMKIICKINTKKFTFYIFYFLPHLLIFDKNLFLPLFLLNTPMCGSHNKKIEKMKSKNSWICLSLTIYLYFLIIEWLVKDLFNTDDQKPGFEKNSIKGLKSNINVYLHKITYVSLLKLYIKKFHHQNSSPNEWNYIWLINHCGLWSQ